MQTLLPTTVPYNPQQVHGVFLTAEQLAHTTELALVSEESPLDANSTVNRLATQLMVATHNYMDRVNEFKETMKDVERMERNDFPHHEIAVLKSEASDITEIIRLNGLRVTNLMAILEGLMHKLMDLEEAD